MQLNACSTNLSGIAAVKLAHQVDKPAPLLAFAKRCSDFVDGRLKLPSGLVQDGPTGGPTWTYNTGAAITLACLLGYESRASEMVAAALDRGKGLFDLSVKDPEKRFWWDQTYFVHLLVEGLVVFVETYGHRQEKLAAVAREEVGREMGYLLSELRDADGLTWRNYRLYKIGERQVERFRIVCGEKREGEWDESERWVQEDVEVGRRRLCKTLLGSAGSARALCLGGKVWDQ